MTDISKLFSEDPLNLTKPDIDAIIAKYREARTGFELGDKTAGNTKKVKKTDAPKEAQIDLDDLLSGI